MTGSGRIWRFPPLKLKRKANPRRGGSNDAPSHEKAKGLVAFETLQVVEM